MSGIDRSRTKARFSPNFSKGKLPSNRTSGSGGSKSFGASKRYLIRRVTPGMSPAFRTARDVYSSGRGCARAPRKAAKKKPEWNPYQTSFTKYALSKEQLLRRKEQFKSKNNILLSPEGGGKAKSTRFNAGKAKSEKAKAKAKVRAGKSKKQAKAFSSAAMVDVDENAPPPPASAAAPPAPPAAASNAAAVGETGQLSGTRDAPAVMSAALASGISALSISDTIKQYQQTLIDLEERVNRVPASVGFIQAESGEVDAIMKSVQSGFVESDVDVPARGGEEQVGEVNKAEAATAASSIHGPPKFGGVAAPDATAAPNVPASASASTVEGVASSTDLMMRLAKLEALCQSQKEYIAAHVHLSQGDGEGELSERITPPPIRRF